MKNNLLYISISLLLANSIPGYSQSVAGASFVKDASIFSATKVTLMPNPVTTRSFVDIVVDSFYTRTPGKIYLMNPSGFAVQTKPIEFQKGRNSFRVYLNGTGTGNYIVKVISDPEPGFSYTAQLLIQ